MVDPKSLIVPQDDFSSAFPQLNFRDVYKLETAGERLFITDPIYLADVYNSTDEIASFLRSSAVFLMDFGGSADCPVWWHSPYLVLPISMSMPDELTAPGETQILAEEVITDSGSFIFLPLTDHVPATLNETIEKIIVERNGAAHELPAGKWVFYYEQFPAPQDNIKGLYRNIVAIHEPFIEKDIDL